MTAYTKIFIDSLNITADRARLVDAAFRAEFGTLDGLTVYQIVKEYRAYISDMIDADPEMAEMLAQSYGF